MDRKRHLKSKTLFYVGDFCIFWEIISRLENSLCVNRRLDGKGVLGPMGRGIPPLTQSGAHVQKC